MLCIFLKITYESRKIYCAFSETVYDILCAVMIITDTTKPK